MRTLIILARKHGGKKLEMVGGPEVPVRQQADAFKNDFCRSGINEKYEYAELWSSDAGRLKHRKLISSKKAASIAEERASAEEEARVRAAEKVKLEEKAQSQAAEEAAAKHKAILDRKAEIKAQFSRSKGVAPKVEKAQSQAAEEAALQAELEAEQAKLAAGKTDETKSE